MDVTVYRIVQEALTNALRYAGRARTEIRVAFTPSDVRIDVIDDGATIERGTGSADDDTGAPGAPTTKRGLIGMQERAALFGGRVDAGPRPDHGYAVRAWLPTEPVRP